MQHPTLQDQVIWGPLPPPSVSVKVTPTSVTEDGSKQLTYEFTASPAPTADIAVNYRIGGSAKAGSDFTTVLPPGATTGTITIPAGSTSPVKLTIVPTPDTEIEPDETVVITLQQGTGYAPGTSVATATILNDDLPEVTLAVSPASVTEDGKENLVYTFTRTGPTTSGLSVNYGITGTADGADYSGATPGTGKKISFDPGSDKATVTIDPKADTEIEFNETVILTLASGAGYKIGTTTPITGTIENDDYRLDLILDGLPEESAPPPNELSRGAILPIGGSRVSLIADVPAGRMATLAIAKGADKVLVYRDATGGTPVLEQGRESMLIVGGGSLELFYVEATALSLIPGDIQFRLTTSGGTSILTETVVATAVRVDLDIDSNNDGSIDPNDGPNGTDDWIENTTSKPLVVNDNDSDLDGVPDYADWSIAGKRFTPLIIRVPASLPLASMQLSVSYAASAPDLIKPDYRLPPGSADRPLRIWTRNAMNREPASVTAGGSFVPEGRFADLTTLGFTDVIRTVELYVEGIHTTAGTTAGVSRPISIQLFVGDRLTSTDLVSVSVVSNVLVIGIDGTDTRPWLTGPNAKRPNGLWNSHVRNLIADVEPYAMTIYRYGPVWTGTDSDDIQRDVVARANEIIRDAGGGTKVALVGWSRGAMIALWAANDLSGPAAQVGGMQRTVEFVGLYDPVDMATAIPSDEHVSGEWSLGNAARIQPDIRRVTIVGPKETPNNNVDYPVGLPSYWTGLILTPDPVFVRMSQNDRITALGGTTVVTRIDYNASHGAIGGCPGYNVHLVSIPDGRYDYGLDVERSILSDKDIRNGMRAAGLAFVPDRNKDWYGFPATRPVIR